MLITLLIWIIIVVIGLGYGLGLDHFQKLTPPANRNLLAFSYNIPVFFLGFILINVLASLLSLLMPLALAAFLIIALPGLFLFFIVCRGNTNTQKPRFPLTGFPRWLFIVSGSVLLLLVLWLTSGSINNADTYIYHAQSIHWIESYPAIRGLGNFFIRLAYNSNWFVQNAIFGFAWLGSRSYHVINGLMVWSVCIFIMYEFLNAIHEETLSVEHWTGFFLIPLGLISMGTQSSAPSTDLPAAYAGWMAGYLAIRHLRGTGDRLALFTLTGLSMFAVVIKLFIAPLLLLPGLLCVFLLQKKEWRLVISLSLWMLLILLPWMARNSIISGYAVYPVSATALPVEWRVPQELVDSDQFGIRAWGFNERESAGIVMAQPFRDRITYWFHNLTRNQQGLTLLSLLYPVLFSIGIILLLRKKENAQSAEALLTGMAFFIAELFWLWVSPNLRFGYVYVLFLCALNLALLGVWGLRLFHLPVQKAGLISSIALVIFLALFMARSFEMDEFSQRVLSPVDYAIRSTKTCYINEGKQEILCAREYGECGYHPFPCHAWGSDYVRMYGDSFQDGFFMVLPD